jgi:WASH complex subunit strumpellin
MAQKPKDKNSVDAIPFVVGVITLLKQFHSVYTQQFLAYLGQYVRSLINITIGGYLSLFIPHSLMNDAHAHARTTAHAHALVHVSHVCARVRVCVCGYSDEKGRTQDYPVEVVNILLFLEEFCRYSKMDRKVVEGYLPPYIFDQFTH